MSISIPSRPDWFPPRGTPLPGLIQSPPLVIPSLLKYAVRYFPDTEIVSRPPELPPSSPSFRYTNRQMHRRVLSLSNCLSSQYGIQMGDIVGTIAFNHHRHLECYYGIQSMGAVLHTINPRLAIEQIEYIIRHAGDELILVDTQCVDVVKKLIQRGNLACIHFIVMADEDNMKGTKGIVDDLHRVGGSCRCYETLIAAHPPQFVYPEFPESTAAGLCYTSGTTGNPKGVLYSHRGLMLHTFSMSLPIAIGIHSSDVILVIVPLFHVNGWGFPYAAAMNGAKLVLPGHLLDGEAIATFIDKEKVTVSSAVPTVWLSLFQYLDGNTQRTFNLKSFNRVLIGGSAAPRSMLERFISMGVKPIHLWGMSELSPLGTLCHLLPKHEGMSMDDKAKVLTKVGRALYGVDMRIVDENRKEVTQDGLSSGELEVRGYWVTNGYFKLTRDGKTPATSWETQRNVDADGWFSTGDVVTIDEDGYVTIVDRTKDVIKSGGEWISSIDLENAAVGHPKIAEAAVIGVAHPKWQERPLLVVVKKKNATLTENEVLEYMKTKMPNWYVPDGVEFVDELPHTATGKLSKLSLRNKFKGYSFKQANTAGVDKDDPDASLEEGTEGTKKRSKL